MLLAKKNIKACRVIEVRKNYIVVDFNNFGLIIETSKTNNYQINTLVDVEYAGAVGDVNFKYKLYKKRANANTKPSSVLTAVVPNEVDEVTL